MISRIMLDQVHFPRVGRCIEVVSPIPFLDRVRTTIYHLVVLEHVSVEHPVPTPTPVGHRSLRPLTVGCVITVSPLEQDEVTNVVVRSPEGIGRSQTVWLGRL